MDVNYSESINSSTVVYVGGSAPAGFIGLNANDGNNGLDQKLTIEQAAKMVGALSEAIKRATAVTPVEPPKTETIIGGGMVNGLPADAVRLIREEMQRTLQSYESNALSRITDLIEAKVSEKIRLRTENGMFRDAVEQIVRHLAHEELGAEVRSVIDDMNLGNIDEDDVRSWAREEAESYVDNDVSIPNDDDIARIANEAISESDEILSAERVREIADEAIKESESLMTEAKVTEIANECINNCSFTIDVSTAD